MTVGSTYVCSTLGLRVGLAFASFVHFTFSAFLFTSSTCSPSMTPAFEDAKSIPYLQPSHCTKLRMTHTRKKQLIKAASRNWDQPPPAPGSDECCGSHCQPCVKDLWKEEVIVWKQRWGIQGDQQEKLQPKKVTRICSRMPGSYEW